MMKLKALGVALVWALAGLAHAGLVNGDFSQGFTDWQGEVLVCDGEDQEGCSDSSVYPLSPRPGDDLQPDFSGNFIISSGAAVISTSYSTNDVWAVALYQIFEMPTLSAPGARLELSLLLIVESDDFALAELTDLGGGLPTLGLTDGGKFDVTAFAGRSVELLFLVEDYADLDDTMTIDNIAIKEILAPVPAPAPLALLGVGLLSLGMRRLGSRGGDYA